MTWRGHRAKNDIGKAIRFLAKAEATLFDFYDFTHDTHKELADIALDCGKTLFVTRTVLKELWEQCWGQPPEELREYFEL